MVYIYILYIYVYIFMWRHVSSFIFIAIRTIGYNLQPKFNPIHFLCFWGCLYDYIVFQCIAIVALKTLSNILFTQLPKLHSLRIINKFDWLMNQNQCPYKHFLYPSLVTWALFTQVAKGDYDFVPRGRRNGPILHSWPHEFRYILQIL